MTVKMLVALALGIGAGLLTPATADAATPCAELAGTVVGDAQIVEASDVRPPFAIGGLLHVHGTSGPRTVNVSSPFCRLRAVIRAVPGSRVDFELWLPPAAAWNGRYLGNGVGGFAGAMFYSVAERALRRGYATSITDNGHVGVDSSFGRDPEARKDWGWRGAHETAVASKAIVQLYYGAAAHHSYFMGCSKGGGSAIMEVQRFPHDFDGVIAGAMGWNHSGQMSKYLTNLQAAAAPGGWMPPAKLALLHNAVLKACDPHKLGFLTDPLACGFDPASLRCRQGDAADCLTDPQLATVRRIYAGPTDANGTALYAGHMRGSELGWSRTIMGSEGRGGTDATTFASMRSYIGDLLLRRSDWDFRTLDPADIMRRSQAEIGSDIDATDPDLGPFEAAGGKLIGYIGWNDLNVPPEGNIRYYENVTRKMGGLARVQAFYRLFMAPGVDHCSGGDGPDTVGGPYDGEAASADADHDILMALERWVEQKTPPQHLVATRYVDGDRNKGFTAQGLWCAFPQVPTYRGGATTAAASFACATPRRPRAR